MRLLETNDVTVDHADQVVIIGCPCGEELVLKLGATAECPGCQVEYRAEAELIVHVTRDGVYQGSYG